MVGAVEIGGAIDEDEGFFVGIHKDTFQLIRVRIMKNREGGKPDRSGINLSSIIIENEDYQMLPKSQTGQASTPSVREAKGHQSGNMLTYVGELIYTEQKYIEDMKEYSSMLEDLLRYRDLTDSDRIIIKNYKEIIDGIVNKNALLQKIGLSKNIYDKIEKIFDDLGIPPEERREKIQDALPILRDKYIAGEYNDLDENIMSQLFHQTLDAFKDPSVIAYINSFDPLIANSKAFGEYIEELATRCPINRSIVTKLVGSESYSIKPTQRSAKYQLHVDQMRGGTPYTVAGEKKFKDITKDETLNQAEKKSQLAALLADSTSTTSEKSKVEATYQDVLTVVGNINKKRKSVTVLDLRVNILLERTQQAFDAWQAQYPGNEHKATFAQYQARLADIGARFEKAQIRTESQILDDAKNKPTKDCTRNELLLKQLLAEKSRLESKYEKELQVTKTKLVFSKKKKGLKRKAVPTKHKKAISEIDTLISSLKSQIEVDDTVAQVEKMKSITQDLAKLNEEASAAYGANWPVSVAEVQSVQSEVTNITHQLKEKMSALKFSHKDKLDNALVAAKAAFKSDDYGALQVTLAEQIRVNTSGKPILTGEDLKSEVLNDIAKLTKLTESVAQRYENIIRAPVSENIVKIRLIELGSHANPDLVGIIYNKWDHALKNTDLSYKKILQTDTVFKEGLNSISSKAQQIVTIEAQLSRLEELKSELLDLQTKKFGISYHYDSNRGQLIGRLIEQLAGGVQSISGRKDSAKALEEEIKTLMQSLDNDKSIEILLQEIAAKKEELENSKGELIKQMKVQDRQLEVYSAQLIAQNLSIPSVTPLEPQKQKERSVTMAKVLAEDTLFKLDSVIKQLEFERSKYQIESQFTDKDRKHVKELDDQIVKLKALHGSIEKLKGDNEIGAREKVHKIHGELSKCSHAKVIEHIINDVKDIKKEYEVYFTAQAKSNEGKRIELRDADHIVRSKTNDTVKYDKTSIIIASLDDAAKSYDKMIKLLEAQQHALVGNDAIQNRERIKKYKNAFTEVENMLSILSYGKKYTEAGQYTISNATKDVFAIALKKNAGGDYPLPDSTVRLFKEMEKRAQAILSNKDSRNPSALFRSVLHKEPKKTEHVKDDDLSHIPRKTK